MNSNFLIKGMGNCCTYNKLKSAELQLDGELPVHGDFVPLKIVDIYDGDTVTGIYLDENKRLTQVVIRLVGIDTPEIKPSIKDISIESDDDSDDIQELLRLEKREALLSKSALTRFIDRASDGTNVIAFSSVKKERKRKSTKYPDAPLPKKTRSKLDKYSRRLATLHVLEDGKCIDYKGVVCGSCNCRMKGFDNFHSRMLCCIKSGLCIPKRGISINRWMLDNGYALEYDGGRKIKSVGMKLQQKRRS